MLPKFAFAVFVAIALTITVKLSMNDVERPDGDDDGVSPPPKHPESNGKKASSPTPGAAPAGGKGKSGEWNGVAMTVGTTASQFTDVDGNRIEPIDVNLRHTLAQRVKRMRLLGSQIPDNVAAAPRRVWIDLGARFYAKGSTNWFTKFYRDARSFEAVMFELLDLEATYPASIKNEFFKKFEFIRSAAWTHDRGVVIKGVKMGRVVDKLSEGSNAKKDSRPEWKAPSVDLGAYLLKNFTKADFVVLKMDIEGGEWVLLPHLLETGALDLVDELMLECHPQGSETVSVKLMHQSCIDFINHFRSKGVFAHDWI
jgi:hypothetical protein